MAVKIITDSTADLELEELKAFGVEMAPLSVIFDGKSYKDGTELSKDDFYRMQAEADKLPSTSQVNPDEFVEKFRPHVDNGDEVIGIFISSKISGTYQSALIAKDIIGSDNIYVIDSKTATMALGLLVREAVKMRDSGMSASDMAQKLTELVERTEFVAIVDTLKYLKMGGRISATTAMIGGVLGISPVVAFNDGALESVGRVKGKKAKIDYLLKLLSDKPADPGYLFGFAHSRAYDEASEIRGIIMNDYPDSDSFICELGATIGTHAGPGAFGMAYVRKV